MKKCAIKELYAFLIAIILAFLGTVGSFKLAHSWGHEDHRLENAPDENNSNKGLKKLVTNKIPSTKSTRQEVLNLAIKTIGSKVNMVLETSNVTDDLVFQIWNIDGLKKEEVIPCRTNAAVRRSIDVDHLDPGIFWIQVFQGEHKTVKPFIQLEPMERWHVNGYLKKESL